MLQPLTLKANQSPLMVITDFRYSQGRRSSPSPEGTFEGRGELTISLALANSHAISFFLTESPTLPWDRHPAFHRLTPGITAASSGLLATPVLLWPGQSLPAASTPAPGPHTSRIELDLSRISASVSLIQIAPGLFQSQAEQCWEQTRTPELATAPFQPHGFLDKRMSLSTWSISPT
jgi:hypothetical protein